MALPPPKVLLVTGLVFVGVSNVEQLTASGPPYLRRLQSACLNMELLGHWGIYRNLYIYIYKYTVYIYMYVI